MAVVEYLCRPAAVQIDDSVMSLVLGITYGSNTYWFINVNTTLFRPLIAPLQPELERTNRAWLNAYWLAIICTTFNISSRPFT